KYFPIELNLIGLEIALEDIYKFLNSKKVNDDELWQLRKKPL
ncbi:unnamed protein product, partial [marine sediment metagenome]